MPHLSPRALAYFLPAFLLALPVRAADAPKPPREPAKLAAEFCASCHGPNLTGAAAPNLLDTIWNHGDDPASIARGIRTGWPETGMPPFGAILSDAEVNGLVAYLGAQGNAFKFGRIPAPPPPSDAPIRSELHAFRVETIADGLDTPWGIAFLPDGRILVTERPGRLRVIERGKLVAAPIGGTPKVWAVQDGGLLDVIAHPDFARNGWIYLAFSEAGGPRPGLSETVVVRGRIRDGQWVDQQDIFRAPPEQYYRDTSHYGCRFLWDRTGHLFFTIGERGQATEAQNLASPLGKIHRVLDDGRVPPDNPFANRPGALGSVWTYGNRHVQGLQFHPVTGKLWATEHGPRGGDELNRIEPGRNYGWPVISMGVPQFSEKIEGTERAGMEQPIVFWTPAIAPSGIEFYTGDRFPRWKNHLFVAALAYQELRRIETDGDKVVRQEVLIKNQGRVRDVTTGPDGLLYVAFNNPGRIARLVPADGELVPAPAAAPAPAKPSR